MRIDNALMKDEIGQLTTENEDIRLKAHRVDASKSFRPPVPPKLKIKVSQRSEITLT